MDFTHLHDILPYQQAKYPQKVALAGKRNGQWHTFSTEDCLRISRQLSAGMLHLGLKKGDTAAIFTHCGSPEWVLTDLALQQIGVIVVPLHATLLPKDLRFILQNAEVRCVFVSNQIMLEKVEAVRPNVPLLQHIFSFEKTGNAMPWEDLLPNPPIPQSPNPQSPIPQSPIPNPQSPITPSPITESDIATILYTSGTTGQPKGVLLSHSNVVSNVKAILTLAPVNYRMDALSFLPLSHIFERMMVCLYMAAGVSVWFSEAVEELPDDFRHVRPHFFTAVPRILEKMHERILETRSKQGALGKKLLDWSLDWGMNYDPLEKLSPVYWLRHQVADWFVYRKWRRTLGGRVQGIAVGAAALQPKLARLFNAAGIPVREGYGLTETSPVVAFNHFEPGLYRFGTVGIPIPGMEVKIDQPDEQGNGEILVKGPNVMQGYHRLPEETAAAFTEDGWLRTGDAGRFVHRRFLQITGRKKDFFKTSSGKFVAPQKIENQLLQSQFVAQCMVAGLNRPCVAALIVPNFVLLEKWCNENGVHWTAPQFMALNPKVLKFMKQVIEQQNQSLEPHEQVKKFTLLHEEWTPAGGELTVTMKPVRGKLMEKFSKEIEEMFES